MKYWFVESPPLKQVDWRRAAICRDTDPEQFFPVGTTGPALVEIAKAQNVCRHCPAIGYCALFALETGQDSGVWGGTSEDDRRSLNRRAARGTVSLIGFAQALHDGYADSHPNSPVLPDLIPPAPTPDPGETSDLPEVEEDVA